MWVFFPRSLIGNETKQSLTPESFQMLLSGTRPSCLILVDKKFYCTIWGENSHWGFLCKWKRRSRRHYRVFMSVLYHDHIRIWKCWFFRGEPENPEPQSKVINQQQTKPTYDIRLELNPATMARGECSHYCANPAARIESFWQKLLSGQASLFVFNICICLITCRVVVRKLFANTMSTKKSFGISCTWKCKTPSQER